MRLRKTLIFLFWAGAVGASITLLSLSAAFLYLNPRVPETATFSQVTLKAPLRILSADGLLIQEFGERLTPITYEDIPPLFERALLDTEDKRFYEHQGIDLVTLLNATWQLLRNRGEIKTGASTITMQLVKNISGESEVRFIRKFKEMLLALKIEREMTKQEIITLYLNLIPFGKHSYGIQAAANTYYGKNVDQLNLAQTAMLAGIPQAPEAGNPINGPERALARRNLVLNRMLEQGSITQQDYDLAVNAPITAAVHGREIELPSPYVADMVRQQVLEIYGREAYSQGMTAYTTVDSAMQLAAAKALRQKLLEYDRRHGYRGPEARRVQGTEDYLLSPEYGLPENWVRLLNEADVIGGQHPGIVTRVTEDSLTLLTQSLREISIPWAGLAWARPYIDHDERGRSPRKASDIAGLGDLVRYELDADSSYRLGQVPDLQGALVALDPNDGAIKALVGGFDFKARQFNHASQARRQPGSIFKPFYYAGAMEEGLTAASIFNDAPIVLPGGELEETYRPRNSSEEFSGNIRLREALYRSINLVSLRVLLDYGIDNAINYVSRFGFDTSKFPRDVQLALGGGTIALTPLEIAAGYASFANGGFKVAPYLIREIAPLHEEAIWHAQPLTACRECPVGEQAERIIDAGVAHIMNSIMSDVMRRGTGAKARRELKRSDLHGKTGTTNDADIWFSGFTSDLVATTWAGFGDNSPVGSREWGSTTPLETWISFMAEVLPPPSRVRSLPRPNNIVSVKIDPSTGQRADPADPDGVFEIFRKEHAPAERLAAKEKDSDLTQEIF